MADDPVPQQSLAPRRATESAVTIAGTTSWSDRAIVRKRTGLVSATKLPILAGLVAVVFFFGGLGGWAATAPLAGAAIAPGTVNPDSQRKSIQHLEGGVVRAIHVREGSEVSAGDVLVTLLDVKASSTFEQDVLKAFALRAQRARYDAERALLVPLAAPVVGPDGKVVTVEPPALVPLAYPEDLVTAAAGRPAFAEILATENDQYEARVEAYAAGIRLLNQAIAKAEAEIVELQSQIDAIVSQARLMDEEIAIIDGLFKQNLESGSRVLQLKRDRLRLDQDRASTAIRIAGDRDAIASTLLEIQNQRAARLEEITTGLATIRADLQTTQERMRFNEDTLDRTIVRSPVDGTVVDLQVHTVGGVVTSGQAIMDIVPRNERLVIDARIAPNDIDAVHIGQSVQVLLLAYPQRRMPIIFGTMRNVSPDTIVNSEGNAYFLGQVEVPPETLTAIDPTIQLVPGMQVELKILTEERTLLDYLLDPVMQSMQRAFVET